MPIDLKKIIKGGVYGTGGGLAGFLSGMGIQTIAEAAGVATIASVPVVAITPLFAFLSAILGFGYAIVEDKR